jgi:hypothetical protein
MATSSGYDDVMTASDEDAPTEKRSFKQALAWATGDRDMEAKELAKKSTDENADDDETDLLPAAKAAVADAHGDTGVRADDAPTSDVATPTDVKDHTGTN